MSYPKIIQGGMGVAVSGWSLAKAVSRQGQLGVVSGTAIAVILARSLQAGDCDGHVRRALEHFPIPGMAERVIDNYFIEGGKAADVPFKTVPMPSMRPGAACTEITILANFVEVYLAKEGHDGVVGINFLEKIQLPTLPSIYGAMLAEVDYVLMGAGIPRAIPGILDRLAEGQPVEMKLDVEGAQPGETFQTELDPRPWFGGTAPTLKRPRFLGIVASTTLAMTLARKASGRVDGFVVEGETAGGHNAPPRGTMQLSDEGEPIYGARDQPDLKKIGALGLPFWLAGSFGRPGGVEQAIKLGAQGVQVGTGFAYCNESGIRPEVKKRVIELSREGEIDVFTDPVASPTGFPFKVAQVGGTLSDDSIYQSRQRVCDLGFLRRVYRKEDGSAGYRCPAEPVDLYMKRGGKLEETYGRKCVCNGLFATVGHGQLRKDGEVELPLITAGMDLGKIAQFLKPGCDSYSAADVIERLLNPVPTDACAEEA